MTGERTLGAISSWFCVRHNASIDENNLAEYIDHADSLTSETIAGFLYVCHMFLHMNYRPYGVS